MDEKDANQEDQPNDEDLGLQLEPLDPIFHSFLLDGPFEECLVCSRELEDVLYLIHKTWMGDEVIFEYAICHPCSEKLQEEMSRESNLRVGEFLEENRRLEATYEGCNYCEKPLEDCRERSLHTACVGLRMDTRHYPLMICGECGMKVNELLSQQTRDRRDRFIGDHFDCPPAMEIPLPTDVVSHG